MPLVVADYAKIWYNKRGKVLVLEEFYAVKTLRDTRI